MVTASLCNLFWLRTGDFSDLFRFFNCPDRCLPIWEVTFQSLALHSSTSSFLAPPGESSIAYITDGFHLQGAATCPMASLSSSSFPPKVLAPCPLFSWTISFFTDSNFYQ